MSDEEVIYEVKGHVAYVCLNRPAVHNALTPGMVRQLANIWRTVSHDRAVRVAILRANGKSFCSGRDIKQTDVGFGPRPGSASSAFQDDEWTSRPGEPRRINYVPPPWLHKPVIAAVQGLALGGGAELALNSDIRVCSTDARFALPEVTRGLVPGSGGLYWLPRMIGVGLAMEFLLTGNAISAQRAYEIGLVNRVVAPAEVLSVAEDLAARIVELPPLSVQAVKEGVWRTVSAAVDEGLRLTEQQSRLLHLTRDAAEAVAAFEQKRAPIFEGR